MVTLSSSTKALRSSTLSASAAAKWGLTSTAKSSSNSKAKTTTKALRSDTPASQSSYVPYNLLAIQDLMVSSTSTPTVQTSLLSKLKYGYAYVDQNLFRGLLPKGYDRNQFKADVRDYKIEDYKDKSEYEKMLEDLKLQREKEKAEYEAQKAYFEEQQDLAKRSWWEFLGGGATERSIRKEQEQVAGADLMLEILKQKGSVGAEAQAAGYPDIYGQLNSGSSFFGSMSNTMKLAIVGAGALLIYGITKKSR